MTQTYIGVDLSKDWLDIHDPQNGACRLANTEAALRRWIAGLDAGSFLVFEATSLCDAPLRRVATAAKLPFHRLNPLHGWHFSRSLNRPKTDALDARMLARLGAERGLTASPGFDPVRAELAELTARRDQLKRMQTQEKNRLQKCRSAPVRADIAAVLRDFAARIAHIEGEIAGFLRDHPDLARKARLLGSIPGIGPVSSAILLAHMPELGALDRRAIASLAGLAPRARDSGRWRGHRYIGDGRRNIRRALYMAAVSQMRTGSPFQPFVQRLRNKGKPGKIIAIALARKLVTRANAVLRDNTEYVSTPA